MYRHNRICHLFLHYGEIALVWRCQLSHCNDKNVIYSILLISHFEKNKRRDCGSFTTYLSRQSCRGHLTVSLRVGQSGKSTGICFKDSLFFTLKPSAILVLQEKNHNIGTPLVYFTYLFARLSAT